MLKYFLVVILLIGISAKAQNINGRVIDASDNSPVIGADVLLIQKSDTTIRKGRVTDTSGRFSFSGIQAGDYTLRAYFMGYNTLNIFVKVGQDNVDLGNIKLSGIGLKLKAVEIKEHQVRAEQNGDTTSYHADAFKTNKDASAEDLVGKMPGITVNNGTVTAHGEQVQQVLVDGKPFLGDDPAAALKNLPAEVVDKIQIFDKKSDQAQFTGFDDGNTQKTMNIITKKNKRNGLFGKAYAGYGTDNRYSAGLAMNSFEGNRRITLLGMSNNVNQQNFSTQDLLGVMGSSGQRGGFGGGRTGASIGGPMMFGGGGGLSNFLVGSQGGINTTNSAGLNYSDSLSHKVFISGSYFFNSTANNTNSTLARTYFISRKSPMYDETDINNSLNLNNRLNIRLEYKLDTNNDLIFTPTLSTQNNLSKSSSDGFNFIPPDTTLSHTNNSYYGKNTGYNYSQNVLLRHKFEKRGRTISVNLGTTINNRTGNDTLHYTNQYYLFGELAKDSTASQHSHTPSQSYSTNANVNYTEPVGKTGQLQLDYAPSVTRSVSEKETYFYNPIAKDYTILDTALSSNYNNTTITNKEGLSYRDGGKKIQYMVGVHYQTTNLDGAQITPYAFAVNKTFNSVLPNAMFTEKFGKTGNNSLRVFYNTSTSIPSISQLQNVINNTNPLMLSTGNPNLSQQYNSNLTLRFAHTKSAQNFFFFISGQQTNNYIANKTVLALRDSVLPNGILLARGSQITSPVNLNNYWSLRSFGGYGLPVDFIKSNLNLLGGVSYTSSPGLINNRLNYANTTNFSPGMVLSSNVSENLDFTISYNANYNLVKNTIQSQGNQNYYYQVASAKLNWVVYKGFVLNTDITHTLYTGLGSYDQSFFLWNASIAKKLFKDQNGEIKLYVYDILNQNNSVSRSVSPTYIDDTRTQVLRQYFMLSFTYTLRNFHGEMPKAPEHKMFPGMRPPMQPGGGGFTPGQQH